MRLLILTVFGAVSSFVQANNMPHGEKCCDVTCYKRLEYADDHDVGNASKDCKSYLRTTATPCPSTTATYTYATVTATVCPNSGTIRHGRRDVLEARNNYPAKCTPKYSKNEQPRYANGFCKDGDFSSACSCLGVKPTTTTLPASTSTVTKAAGTVTKYETSCTTTTTSSTTPIMTTTSTSSSSSSSTTATSSSVPKPTACSNAQSTFCTSQQQNSCTCQLDVDGVTPICSNGAVCPQSTFPNPPPPCSSDADCVLDFPGSVYNRCVYTNLEFFCSPTYCATEQGCMQQHPIKRSVNVALKKAWVG